MGRLTVSAAALISFALAVIVIVPRGVIDAGGAGGGDAHAYWVAGQNALTGADLYTGPSGGKDAYLYPPPFAQLLAPFAAALPAPAFVWAWQLFSVVCLVIAAGGWRTAGIALLVFPPAIVELDMGNVHFELAALCAMTLRGNTWAIPVAALLKLAGGGAIPFALRRNWRALVRGAVAVGIVVVASFALSPRAWFDYASFLSHAHKLEYWTNLGQGVPLLLRLVVAGGVGLLAIRRPALVPVAFVLSMPMVSVNSLAILVCVAPLMGGWVRRIRARRRFGHILPTLTTTSEVAG